MGCKVNSPNAHIPFKFPTKRAKLGGKSTTFCTISTHTHIPKSDLSTVHFRTLKACKLGISRYPDFEYDAEGGSGTASAAHIHGGGQVSVSFDVETLYIPPLTAQTTKFLGLPLPPFLKIDILPEFLRGNIDKESGEVALEFKAKFLFSVGGVYKAPPLLVSTVLTSEESQGAMRRGRGQRLDKEGNCRLVGVATVDPIDDFVLNSFLSLPTECIATLNAIISFS